MSLIKKPFELEFQPNIKMLLYGQPGAGKTTLALSAPDPLLIDTDGGIHRVNYGHLKDAVQVKSYNDVLEVLKEDLSAYKTIIFDTGGKLLDFIAEYIIKNNPKMGKRNGTLTLQGYGERKQEFSALCKKVQMLNKHIVFVAHREASRDKADDTIRYVPLFGGSNYDSLVTELDLVGYIETYGRQRTITFDPTDRNDGKNTCGMEPVINIPLSVDDNGNALDNNFLDEVVIKRYIDRINKNKEEGIKYNNIIEDWGNKLRLTDNVDELNMLLDGVNDMEHVGTSLIKCKVMLNNRAKELKTHFDKESKQFVND